LTQIQQVQQIQAITPKSEDKTVLQNQLLESTLNCPMSQKSNE
jgi:hypothetical protein